MRAGLFASTFPELMSDFGSYSVDRVEERDGVSFAWVTCRNSSSAVTLNLHFVLDKKPVGLKKGAWMTARLLRQQV